MLFAHRGKSPSVHATAYVAPTATICGDVRIGPGCQVGFGAVLLAEGQPISVGESVIIREQALIRSTATHEVSIGDFVLVGPHASLMGCRVDDEAFLATGTTIFHGARIGRRAEVRVNAVVHVNSIVPAGLTVPIAWVAVGNPAELFPPSEHERIWEIQERLDFPRTVYGLERKGDGTVDMRELTKRVARSFSEDRSDEPLKPPRA